MNFKYGVTDRNGNMLIACDDPDFAVETLQALANEFQNQSFFVVAKLAEAIVIPAVPLLIFEDFENEEPTIPVGLDSATGAFGFDFSDVPNG